MFICERMDRQLARIRIATNTTDADRALIQATTGNPLRGPRYFESETRLLGWPVFAIAWGGTNSVEHRSRAVYGWIAAGDIAVSPLLAFGGVAIAPIAVGAISV